MPNILKSGKQTSWGIADQALSSLTNFVLGVFVARSVSSKEFGAFGLVFATYLFTLGASRALNTAPLVVRYSASNAETWREGTRAATGAALVVGTLAGMGCVLAGILLGEAVGPGLAVLGVTLPGLLLQDSWRQAFFANGKGSLAFANDVTWALLLFPLVAVVIAAGHAEISWFMFAWGASASGAAILGTYQARIKPNPLLARKWWSAQWDLAPRYFGEFLALGGSNQLIIYGTGAIAGLTAAGALRAAQILLGPFNVAFEGLWISAVPMQVRALKKSPDRLRSASITFSLLLGVSAIACGILLLLLPASVGRALLGPSWPAARAILVPMTLAVAGLGAAMGAMSGLRALAAARRSLRARIVTSTMTVTGGLAGAAAAAAMGAASGRALAMWLATGLWWWHFMKALGDHQKARGLERDLLAHPLEPVPDLSDN